MNRGNESFTTVTVFCKPLPAVLKRIFILDCLCYNNGVKKVAGMIMKKFRTVVTLTSAMIILFAGACLADTFTNRQTNEKPDGRCPLVSPVR